MRALQSYEFGTVAGGWEDSGYSDDEDHGGSSGSYGGSSSGGSSYSSGDMYSQLNIQNSSFDWGGQSIPFNSSNYTTQTFDDGSTLTYSNSTGDIASYTNAPADPPPLYTLTSGSGADCAAFAANTLLAIASRGSSTANVVGNSAAAAVSGGGCVRVVRQ
jgi:hypothetical protein